MRMKVPRMITDFFTRALIAGVCVALVAGPAGCFIVWRRMAYFGDTMAHSALLGVALGLLLGVDPVLGVLAVSIVLALILAGMGANRTLASDTVLGILSHSALSLGMIALSLMQGIRLDLMVYLFGDLLSVGMMDIAWIAGGGGVSLALLLLLWRPLLAMTVHEELARAEGVKVDAVRAGFMLLIAFLIAAAMKITGALLITSLLLIPAACARRFANGPGTMAVLAALYGSAAVVGGLYGSLHFDTPSGPSIVLAALLLFLCGLVFGRRPFRS
ncbi:MAG: metal ABC transporter permease [Alphaproteobacteria bacterium]|nr:metal ABC transporter permease [Alphaproteobacteria bacterium]